jgi:hypothetical protein
MQAMIAEVSCIIRYVIDARNNVFAIMRLAGSRVNATCLFCAHFTVFHLLTCHRENALADVG